MAKASNSVIGVDLGRFSLKSVLLQRKGGNRFVVTNFASRAVTEPLETVEALTRELKTLFKEMGGAAKTCAIGVSYPGALIRIIEQPETPPFILRDALRLNGMALLNQDCKDFVLDCDRIPSPTAADHSENGHPGQKRYLVGGLPRTEVAQIGEAVEKTGSILGSMQLGPVCSFNAFEFANPEVFANEAFFSRRYRPRDDDGDGRGEARAGARAQHRVWRHAFHRSTDGLERRVSRDGLSGAGAGG